MTDRSRIIVVGAGAFGTALACVLAQKDGHEVTLLGRDADAMRQMALTRQNARSLPDRPLPDALAVSADPSCLQTAGTVLFAMPSQQQAEAADRLKPFLKAGATVIICAKGLDRATGGLLTQKLETILPQQAIAVLSGPGFAADIAKGLPTAMVVAAKTGVLAETLATLLSTRTFRLYASDDRTGVQLCGALKNVLAIASGMVAGAGLGQSARAALIARGLAEMTRFIVAAGGQAETVSGLSGLGDLVLTATSQQSRNFRFGTMLGQGQRSTGHELVEGALAASVAVRLAKDYGLDLPITEAVAAIIEGRLDVATALQSLMSRRIKQEVEKN